MPARYKETNIIRQIKLTDDFSGHNIFSSAISRINLFLDIFFWALNHIILAPVIGLFYKIKVTVDPDLFKNARRPVIIAANHKAMLDPWLLLVGAMPLSIYLKLVPITILGTRKFNFPVPKFLNKIGVTGFIYWLYSVVTIDTADSTPQQKIDPFIWALKRKNSILIFPEGGMERRRGVNPFRWGVIAIHQQTGVPILPCAIRPIGKELTRGWRREIHFNLGSLIYDAIDDRDRETNSPKLTYSREKLHEAIVELYEKS